MLACRCIAAFGVPVVPDVYSHSAHASESVTAGGSPGHKTSVQLVTVTSCPTGADAADSSAAITKCLTSGDESIAGATEPRYSGVAITTHAPASWTIFASS